nr:outer membrane beta-barrel protein [Mucilaginibacter sp. L294]
MRKLLLLFVIVAGAAFSASAQSSSESGKFSIGLEAGLPVGDAKTVGGNLFIGGSLKYDQPIATGTFFTISAGYTSLSFKDTYGGGSLGYAPVKVGVKYFLAESFYGEAQVGAAFGTKSGTGTSFAYSPGIGYAFGGGVDLGIRYEAWSKSGITLGQVAARLAYSF